MKAADLVHTARKQVERTDRKITEASDEISIRLARMDQRVGAALDSVDATGSRIRHAVLTPFSS